MKLNRVFHFYIFLTLILFGICRGSNKHLLLTSSVNSRLLDLLQSFNKDIDDPSAAIIAKYSRIIKERNDQIARLKIMVGERTTLVAEYDNEWNICFSITSTCLHSKYSTEVYELKPPGIKDKFSVLCDNQIAGPGWMVIQQRINGSESFQRNWTEYRDGFGSLDGDYFMGLEKIHQLTRFLVHGLYIYMETKKENKTLNITAHFEGFHVKGEDDLYRLSTLGRFTGLEVFQDATKEHQQKLLKIVRESFKDPECGESWDSGWWYWNCGKCLLNGKFFSPGLLWNNGIIIEKIVMLIRAL